MPITAMVTSPRPASTTRDSLNSRRTRPEAVIDPASPISQITNPEASGKAAR
jgi:hypothetical protein